MDVKLIPVRGGMYAALALLITILLTGSMPLRAESSETKLTAEEVQAVFIGVPWHTVDGAFLFRDDGTYTYKRFDAVDPRGTWEYRLRDDGTIETDYTKYIFYRTGDGYRYFHTRSQKQYPAYPNKPPFL